MGAPSSNTELSVIVPVGSRHADAAGLHAEYQAGLDALRRPYELIFVLDGPQQDLRSGLQKLIASGERFTVISLARSLARPPQSWPDFRGQSGTSSLRCPPTTRSTPPMWAGWSLPLSVATLRSAVVGRAPVAGSSAPAAGHFTDCSPGLLTSNSVTWRAGRAPSEDKVLEEIHLYGDQHRFLAVLADRHGFKVSEIDLRQSPKDRYRGIYGPREYVRSFLDIFTVFFLVRFTQKPLRFFGMIGVTTFGLGALWIVVLVVQRLFLDQALADRPALLLSSLLVVLGLQIFALGLLGELIIFTHARHLRDYQIAEIIQFTEEAPTVTDAPREEMGSAVR